MASLRQPIDGECLFARHVVREASLGALPMTEWYLVWIDGPRGPEPQKWSPEGLWGQLGRQDVLVRFALTEQEAKLSLNELAKRHPVPGK